MIDKRMQKYLCCAKTMSEYLKKLIEANGIFILTKSD